MLKGIKMTYAAFLIRRITLVFDRRPHLKKLRLRFERWAAIHAWLIRNGEIPCMRSEEAGPHFLIHGKPIIRMPEVLWRPTSAPR